MVVAAIGRQFEPKPNCGGAYKQFSERATRSIRAGYPPPSTMETDGPDKFAAEWRDRLELGYFTQWTGRPPIFRVSVGFPDRRTDVEPGFRSATLACYLDADYATRESDETATAFARVGSELGSFYGCAYLLSGWRFSRGILSMNAFSSDQSPLPSGSRWIGIPPGNPWLEWFGGAYLEAAPESAPATSTRHARGFSFATPLRHLGATMSYTQDGRSERSTWRDGRIPDFWGSHLRLQPWFCCRPRLDVAPTERCAVQSCARIEISDARTSLKICIAGRWSMSRRLSVNSRSLPGPRSHERRRRPTTVCRHH